MEYRPVGTIGGKGSGPGRFSGSLTSLCVDRRDRLYAAGDSQVIVFDRDGAPVRRFSTAKPAAAVAVTSEGSIFAGESGQIEIFDRSGKVVSTWRDAEKLAEVTAIGFFRDSVLVGDARSRSIRRFDRAGRFLNDIGKDNRTRGFLIPNGVLDFDVDAQGIIHAANPGKHRVERYTLEGQLLGHIGRFDGLDPEGFAGCCNPTNLALGPQGQVYVTEKAGPRAKVLDSAGALLSMISDSAFDPACKNMDVAVDSRGRVYVADTVKLHILAFEPTAGPAKTETRR